LMLLPASAEFFILTRLRVPSAGEGVALAVLHPGTDMPYRNLEPIVTTLTLKRDTHNINIY